MKCRFTKKNTWRNLLLGKGFMKNDLSYKCNYPGNIQKSTIEILKNVKYVQS